MGLASPLYVDSNVLVAGTITKHPLYGPAAQLIGELLLNQTTLMISLLTVHECLWALAQYSYLDLNPGTGPNWNQKIYRRWRDRIFESYSDRLGAVTSMLQDWSQAGIPLLFVPDEASFLNVSDLTLHLMRVYPLAPGDAAHLALARTYAKAFVTADKDFASPAEDLDDLTVIHLAA